VSGRREREISRAVGKEGEVSSDQSAAVKASAIHQEKLNYAIGVSRREVKQPFEQLRLSASPRTTVVKENGKS
jgi:hypothetical protein